MDDEQDKVFDLMDQLKAQIGAKVKASLDDLYASPADRLLKTKSESVMVESGSQSATESAAASQGKDIPAVLGSDRFMNGRLLIAMPQLNDKRFHRAVIFICMHREDGAMGIVINRLVGGITYGELMRQLGIELDANSNDRPVHFGGPVEPSRGFVLHSPDRVEENTVLIEGYGLTSTTDILRAIHKGEGPNRNILALGYAGWGPGQLDSELRQNSWLAVNPDEALVFDLDFDTKWERAIAKLGVDFAMLSTEAGHA